MYNKRCLKYGEMAERSKAAVLKTVVVNSYLGFESLSLRQRQAVRTLGSCSFLYDNFRAVFPLKKPKIKND